MDIRTWTGDFFRLVSLSKDITFHFALEGVGTVAYRRECNMVGNQTGGIS
jgi:hypothetical protein